MTVISFAWVAWMVSTTALYWLLPHRFRSVFLIGVTLLFLITIDWISAVILAALTCLTYVASIRAVSNRILIPLAIATVIGVLVFYKSRVSANPAGLLAAIAMPLGLSYYSFRLIHYVVERARGTLPEHGFEDYVSYLFFLPTIVVGPIHRFREFYADRQANTWKAEDISGGMVRILNGYFKVAVLGNFILSRLAQDWIASFGSDMKPLVFYLEAVRGTFLLYILFSGYSDIAIGFARTLGFHVMENFRWPFLQKSIADFWRNWHISLTSWSREYIFTTVIGVTRNPVYGTLASLLMIGVWHELSPRYVAWGLYHGLGIVAVAEFQKWKRRRVAVVMRPQSRAAARTGRERFADGLKILATMNYCFFGYIIIASNGMSEVLDKYYTILFSWWT